MVVQKHKSCEPRWRVERALPPALALLSLLLGACEVVVSPVSADAGVDGGGSSAGGAAAQDGGGGGGDDAATGAGSGGATGDGGGTTGLKCAEGYTCFAPAGSDVVWVMKNDGNVNGPSCDSVCVNALSRNCEYRACDAGRPIAHHDMAGFSEIASGLGFSCRAGGCWDSVSPTPGQYLVSIATDADGSKSCFFPTETAHSCSNDPGNANCFGERYASVCPCVVKPLDQACEWSCPPNNTTRAVWKTSGTSCLERINYWRKKACEDGWVECPPAGLPPMIECTACNECANSEADWDSKNGAHNSFTRCGEFVQGEGGGATCADVIDGFVSERAPDKDGVMRCTGHCGPIVEPGCQTFHWGKARDSDFHTLNWGNCDVAACQGYCDGKPGDCFTVPTSPSLTCADPDVGAEPGPVRQACL
ncbi:MAG: hypothetical protein FJ104_03510 [Deltaproteobacteria bacterium]|nr:hypothetical protein [Deltaproteobacteria bacterium]